MQYTKLGFYRFFKGCSSHQVPCSLIVNRSEAPTLHIANVTTHYNERKLNKTL